MALYSPAYNAHVGKHFIIQVSLAQGGGEMANGELLRTTQLILLWEDYTIHWTGDPTTTLQMCVALLLTFEQFIQSTSRASTTIFRCDIFLHGHFKIHNGILRSTVTYKVHFDITHIV